MIPLQHQAAAAVAAIDAARTPAQKYVARQEGLSTKAALEKQIADENFKTAFKNAKPQSMIGVYKGDHGLVVDHPVFLVGPVGTKIVAPVTLPDGSKAVPNAGYQISIPARFLPEMLARGFLRVNDAAITDRGLADPTRSNNT